MNFNPIEIQPRKQLRMSGYDYRMPGYYFVTLCVNNRACLFGEILNGEMHLNAAGQMIQGVWHRISEQYRGWRVDTLIVMPNHVHVIVVLDDVPTPTLSLPELMRNIISYTMTCYRHGVYNHHWLGFYKHLWQRSYYEHVICNESSLENIRHYIVNNPTQWEMDEENPENFGLVGAGLRAGPSKKECPPK